MKKILVWLTILLCAATILRSADETTPAPAAAPAAAEAPAAESEPETVIPEDSVSDQRLTDLARLLHDANRRLGPAATAQALSQAVTQELLKRYPQLAESSDRPALIEVEQSDEQARRLLTTQAVAKYPNQTDAQWIAAAEKEYPLYKKNDKVTIRYFKNPHTTTTMKGTFKGMANGRILLDGNRTVRIHDMRNIEENDGEHGEIAKFDHDVNRQLRADWIDAQKQKLIEDRKAFVAKGLRSASQKRRQQDFLVNEKNGYTYVNDEWLAPKEFIDNAIDAVLADNQRQQKEHAAQVQNARNSNIQAQGRIASARMLTTPPSSQPSIPRNQYLAKLKKIEEARAAKAAAEAKAKAEAEAKAKAEAEEQARRDKEAKEKAEAERKAREAQAQEPEAEKGLDTTTIAIGVVVLILIAGGVVWWLKSHGGEKDLDVSKFFEGKGKLQKEFWDDAAKDPDHFKYVAYLFPNIEAAQNALTSLSFLYLDASGFIALKNGRNDIRFGSYEHQGKAVAFLGGQALNYARWREASMVWPELPEAQYFKVSSEPIVKLILPKLDDLQESEGIKVDKIGEEDVRTETGEINKVFRYFCATKDMALQFLAKLNVEEEGVVIRVETEQGEFGKDINGIFTV